MYWKNIYTNKISNIFDKTIAEFNFKLLNILLCCNLSLSKWKHASPKCSNCLDKIKNSKHLIFECINVMKIWKTLESILNFEIQWKHLVVGFYYEDNNKVVLLNNLLSYVACRIYKYKMFCRINSLQESEISICQNLKSHLKFTCSVIKKSNISLQTHLFNKLSEML